MGSRSVLFHVPDFSNICYDTVFEHRSNGCPRQKKRFMYFKDSFNLPCILVRERKVLKMSDHILLCIPLKSFCRYVLETFSRSDSPLD